MALALVSAAACGAFKSSGDDGAGASDAGVDGSSGGGGADGGENNNGGRADGGHAIDAGYAVEGTGPGPHGALPTGYCCASDTDCRGRQCLEFSGGKMCSDGCVSDDICSAGSGFTCVGASASADGHCEPPAGATCIPADDYQRGAKTLGACCTATHEGHNGFECQGGRCDSFLDENQPYICTQACEKASDCPGAFDCVPVDTHYAVCAPSASTSYTCTGP